MITGTTSPCSNTKPATPAAVGAMQDADSFRRYLDRQANFHRYSSDNGALMLAQREDATRVAGYRLSLVMTLVCHSRI